MGCDSESIYEPTYSTGLFNVAVTETGYLVTVEADLPEKFQKINFEKTTYHRFDFSNYSLYVHDSRGAGNYGTYKFLMIYQNLDLNYDIQTIIPLPLNLKEQSKGYTLYTYDGYESLNHYYGEIVIFIHDNKKAFILQGNLGFVTSTSYKLKEYFNLP